MRFQEFKVKENIAPFMQAMIGGNVSPFSSVMSSEKDKTSDDSKTDTTDNTQTTKSDSSGKPIDAAAGSPFGMRNGKPHNGTDFPTPIGTPVKAPESGLISRTGS
jgi:murein DD-endopeptidase MepM/ murein hydrolase activator NlpD